VCVYVFRGERDKEAQRRREGEGEGEDDDERERSTTTTTITEAENSEERSLLHFYYIYIYLSIYLSLSLLLTHSFTALSPGPPNPLRNSVISPSQNLNFFLRKAKVTVLLVLPSEPTPEAVFSRNSSTVLPSIHTKENNSTNKQDLSLIIYPFKLSSL
jgi:hypothetical protein